jgi:hypothetical protein
MVLAEAAAAARCRSLVARRCDIVGRCVGGAWSLRDCACLEAHGGALRGRERDVGNVVGVVAAEEGEERRNDVEGEE